MPLWTHVLGLKRNLYRGKLLCVPCRMHSIGDTRALVLYLRAAVMPSPSWGHRGACGVHHSYMAFDHQCQPWEGKETVAGLAG